ncbi:hypothetical protein, conserved [Eimeria acervulina]|uniref:TB2/DP1, HVA22 domain-containing protein n=1 Tax=Eimeria acervulina TaxID=5801 RepID=U6G8B0_EIMAC|nr:hypothetical protein, conserved [Eimeria acervulina]CDI76420.1 hypothetical protein, conserved [Eimeria acervulina]
MAFARKHAAGREAAAEHHHSSSESLGDMQEKQKGGGSAAAGGGGGGGGGAGAAAGGAPAAAAVRRLFSNLDKYLEDATLAQQASSFTGLRPSVLVIALGLFLIISLGTGIGGGLVCDVAGFLYPAWMSFRAIESAGAEDDKLWLTYWVVYGAFSIAEYFVDFILFWGAETVYNCFVRPFLLQHQQPIDICLQGIENASSKAAANLHQVVQEGFTTVQGAVAAVRRVS